MKTIKFCEACSVKDDCGEDLMPQHLFIDGDAEKADENKASCDLIFETGKTVFFIEQKYLYYFCRFYEDSRRWESLRNVVRDKIKGSVEDYFNPPKNIEKALKFLLVYSKKVKPSHPRGKYQFEEIEKYIGSAALLNDIRTALLAIDGVVGGVYHTDDYSVALSVSECSDVEKQIFKL